MSNIKQFQPKNTITLFDRSIDPKLTGVLYFKQNIPVSTPFGFIPETNSKAVAQKREKPSNRWLDSRYSKASKFELLNFRVLAIIFLMLSIIGFSSLILPVAVAETNLRISYFEQNTGINLTSTPTPSPTPFDNSKSFLLDKTRETETIPQNFSIKISKINLDSMIIPNVDPSFDTSYQESLRQGVAHAKGSYLPGDKGTIFLFAHSTDIPEHITQYNAKFYALKELQEGDQIELDYNGKTYNYQVYGRKITNPFDLDTIRQSGADLILQTCWPPGTDWQRLMVFAKQI